MPDRDGLEAHPSAQSEPLNSSFPKKMAYLRQDILRWAKRQNVSITFPRVLSPQSGQPPAVVLGKQHPMNTEAALRCALVAQKRGAFDAYHRSVYRAFWGEGKDISQEEVLREAIERIGQDYPSFKAALGSPTIEAELSRLTQEADDRGVFGVPTFFCRG
jgi:2-hydroxychromene-2-carboxylate isomerase